MIRRSLNHDVATAERLVRQAVRGHPLTQQQFDAAVSFVYNTGRPDVLRPANNGDMAAVARRMRSFVMVCRHDAHGRVIPGSCRASHGLIHRRRLEAAPFTPTRGHTP
jgi:lysozyme